MSAIIVGFILGTRVLILILSVLFMYLWPILLIIAVIVLYIHCKKCIEKEEYYNECKANGISPADNSSNHTPLTRDNIYRERDSWL